MHQYIQCNIIHYHILLWFYKKNMFTPIFQFNNEII